jgi:hypothetical protein
VDTKSKAEIPLAAESIAHPFYNCAHRDFILALLGTLGIKEVQIQFDGSGDSGTISEPALPRGDDIFIDVPCKYSKWENGRFCETVTIEPRTLSQALKQVCEEALENCNVDWYNNDGGFGYMSIDLTTNPPDIYLEVNQRIVDTVHHEFRYGNESLQEEGG